MAKSFSFDAQYYKRFYQSQRSRVVSPQDIQRLATFVAAYLQHLQIPLRRVLDLGCGLGHWQTAMAKIAPKAKYTGVEFSAYLCEKHGWQQGSVVNYASARPFDLVICQGVLQYLDSHQAKAAIGNLAQLCQGALYLEALTKNDWQENVDQKATDGEVYLRQGNWYRKQLAPHFINCGGGLFVSRQAEIGLFELEHLD